MRVWNITFVLVLSAGLMASCKESGRDASQSSDPNQSELPKTEAEVLDYLVTQKTSPDDNLRIFELPNPGQPSSFAAFGQGHNVTFDSTGMTISYSRSIAPKSPSDEIDSRWINEKISINFVGASAGIQGQGLMPTASATTIVRGESYYSNVVAFAGIKFLNVYKGIDLYFLDSDDQFTFVFLLNPGADPNSINIAIEGGDSSFLNANGALVVKKADGEIEITRPYSFQTSGDGKRVVQSEYTLGEKEGLGLVESDTYGFAVGDYSSDLPLIIDPSVNYVKLLGNSNNTRLSSDKNSGDIYIAGPSANFASNSGVFYVGRHDGQTGSLLNQTLIFGGGTDNLRDIFVRNGSVYVVGDTSVDLLNSFVSNPPPVQAARGGSTDSYLIQFDRLTLTPTYGTYFGGSKRDFAAGVRADDDGYIYLAGHTDSLNFPLKTGTASAALFDSYALKFKPQSGGSADIVYVNLHGGTAVENLTDVSLDNQGNFYAIGRTSSANLPLVNALPLAFTPTPLGFNPFVLKFSPQGSLLLSSYAHANDVGSGVFTLGMDVSESGDAIGFGGTVFDAGFNLNGYIMKLAFNTTTQKYESVYSHSPQGQSTIVHDVSMDSLKNLYCVGETGSNFFTTEPTPDLGGISAFLYVLADSGAAPSILYSKTFGGTGSDRATNIEVNKENHEFLIVGSTSSDNFTGLSGPTLAAGSDRGFLIKFGPVVPPPPPNASPTAKLTHAGQLEIKDVAFDLTPDTLNLGSNGQWVTGHITANLSAKAAITLDASQSSDPDGDSLSYSISIAGGSSPLEFNQYYVTVQLDVGNYVATLTVCDPFNACATDQISFSVTRLNLGSIAPGDLTVNGVGVDWVSYESGELTIKVSRAAFAATVAVGDNVPVILDGALQAVDDIRVIDNGGGNGNSNGGGNGNGNGQGGNN